MPPRSACLTTERSTGRDGRLIAGNSSRTSSRTETDRDQRGGVIVSSRDKHEGVFVILDVTELTGRRLDDGLAFFEEHGFVRLKGLSKSVAPAFEMSLAEAMGISDGELRALLDPRSAAAIFPKETRARLSRIPTSPELARTLISALSPLLTTVIGPVLHVSSTYHGQFKGGALSEAAKDIAHYHNEAAADYMEVHGAYRLHQDFTGASLPTSPSGVK